jgi:hypothetical protein
MPFGYRDDLEFGSSKPKSLNSDSLWNLYRPGKVNQEKLYNLSSEVIRNRNADKL